MSNFSTDKDYEEFLDGERAPLLHYIRGQIRDYNRVDDLMQMAFAKFWEDRECIVERAVVRQQQDGSERPLDSYLRAWLRTVVKNEVRDGLNEASAKNVPLDENVDLPEHRFTEDGSSAGALSITSLYTDFVEQLGRHEGRNWRFRAWAAACVRLDGYTYEEAAIRMKEEAPELQEGHSTAISAQRSRVEAAVKRVDADFMKWLYGGELLPEK